MLVCHMSMVLRSTARCWMIGFIIRGFGRPFGNSFIVATDEEPVVHLNRFVHRQDYPHDEILM